MTIYLLSDEERSKEDETNDEYFYAQPRFVNHLDESFRARLKLLYKQCIPEESIILDLMASWTSHLPDDRKYLKVIGHGLNRLELDKNNRLDSYWLQNLNRNKKFPLEDNSIDVCLMVAAWQYLQFPEDIAQEIQRIMRPGGQLIVSFSNRAFWSKAPRIWVRGSDQDRINYINDVLIANNWSEVESISEEGISKSIFGLFRKSSDPFFAVIAKKRS